VYKSNVIYPANPIREERKAQEQRKVNYAWGVNGVNDQSERSERGCFWGFYPYKVRTNEVSEFAFAFARSPSAGDKAPLAGFALCLYLLDYEAFLGRIHIMPPVKREALFFLLYVFYFLDLALGDTWLRSVR